MGVPRESEVVVRDTLSSKKFMVELTKSASYKKVHQKFGFICQRLADSGLIVKFIATLDRNKINRTPRLGEEEDNTPIEYSISSISDEVLRFIHMVS
jgi:hypothetical protein